MFENKDLVWRNNSWDLQIPKYNEKNSKLNFRVGEDFSPYEILIKNLVKLVKTIKYLRTLH